MDEDVEKKQRNKENKDADELKKIVLRDWNYAETRQLWFKNRKRPHLDEDIKESLEDYKSPYELSDKEKAHLARLQDIKKKQEREAMENQQEEERSRNNGSETERDEWLKKKRKQELEELEKQKKREDDEKV